MTDRVRLLLEDGTVLADGVRPVAEYEAISNEAFEADSDSYDIRFMAPSPVPQEWFDYLEDAMRRHGERMHELYYSGFNAVIKL